MKISASKSRLVVTVGLLVLAGAIMIPRWLSVSSAEGVLNGRAIVVRSPVDGRLHGSLPEIGDPVVLGDRIASVAPHAHYGDQREDLRIGVEIAELDGRIAALHDEIAEIEDLSAKISQRAEIYSLHSGARAEQQVIAAAAALDLASAELDFAERKASLLERLAATGVVAELDVVEAGSVARAAAASLKEAAANLARATIEARAAGLDINLKDGQNDVPYSRQKLEDLGLRRTAVEAELAGLIARRDGLEGLLGLMVGIRPVEAPANAIVWRRGFASGSDVLKGEEIMVLVDCNDLFVQARIDQSDAADIAIGETVIVEISGRPGALPGIVSTMRGTADEARRDDAAAGLQLVGASRWVQIEISVEARDLRIGDSSFCNVGAGARVSFPRKINQSWF